IPSALGHYRDGGNAEYCAAPEEFLARVPDSIPFEQAAILGCPIGVVVNALRDVAALHAGEEVLVTGAGGGVGVHALAWARLSGQEIRLNPANLLFQRARLLGCFGATLAQLEDAARLVALGRLQPVISDALPLAEAAEAHRRLEARESFGRVVLVP